MLAFVSRPLAWFPLFLVACTHTVEGTNPVDQGPTTQTPASSSSTDRTSQPLPVAGQACRCTSGPTDLPSQNCCAGGLVCGDDSGMPGRLVCDSRECSRSGICVDSPFSRPPSSSSGKAADECDPFEKDTGCASGLDCTLVTDHWGCVAR